MISSQGVFVSMLLHPHIYLLKNPISIFCFSSLSVKSWHGMEVIGILQQSVSIASVQPHGPFSLWEGLIIIFSVALFTSSPWVKIGKV